MKVVMLCILMLGGASLSACVSHTGNECVDYCGFICFCEPNRT